MLEADKRAYTFTGQGSQRVGMWDDLRKSARAREIFQLADEIVGFSLSRLCSGGPIEELTKTRNAQPAIVAHSLAALAVAKGLHPELFEASPMFSLGHSVGEYSALVTTGVIDIATAIYLVRQRGLLIEELSPEGSMVALHKFDHLDQVMAICLQTGTEVANFNGPGQIVISGGIKEIKEATRIASQQGINSILLQTSHPFHSSLIRPVQEEFNKVLAKVVFRDPLFPIVLNTKAQPSISGNEIKEAIARQIAEPVRWDESVRYIQEQGVGTFVEFGPKPVLTGLLRRAYPQVRGIFVKDKQSAEALSL